MTPGLRKFALTTHVTSSVGWLGAVVAFLALAIVGLISQDAEVLAAWRPTSARPLTPWGRYVLFGIIAVVLLVLLLHLAGIGLHTH
jgi:hypothetical protein